MNKKPKIALAHEFLVQYGGAEKTFEAIAEIFPNAPIFTAKYDAKNIAKMSPSLAKRDIRAPKGGFFNKASKYAFTFLMAPVFEEMDLRDYDLIISDGNTWNKGILTRPDQLHITYIHTPPRFLYKYSTESTKRDKWYFKLPFSYIDNILRLWDFVSAQRPDYIVANSQEVKNRIQKFYRRQSTVINPPVDINIKNNIETGPDNMKKPYYVITGRVIKYKNFDLVIEAFNLLGTNLIVIGNGEYLKHLKTLAGPTIEFAGEVDDKTKHQLIHHALGLINPVEDEDFGIVPVEAFAHGIPVLAHKSGGHLETIVEGVNGQFFDSLKLESFMDSFKTFDDKIRSGYFDKQKIKNSATKYSKERFKAEFKDFVDTKWDEFAGIRS